MEHMQGGLSWVCLGASITNMYSYKVWLHNVKFMVSRNTWSAELAKCEPADRAWLCANSVWVRALHPLYEVGYCRA